MITPEQKQLWVEALRSGKYAQGRGALYARGTYCCLGVLAEVLKLEYVESHGIRNYEGSEASLREDILFAGQQAVLMAMNDGSRDQCNQERRKALSFNEIADYIEENL